MPNNRRAEGAVASGWRRTPAVHHRFNNRYLIGARCVQQQDDRALKAGGHKPRRWVTRVTFSQRFAAVLAIFSIAAAAAPDAPSGKLSGFLAGVILISIVAYAFFDYIRPLFREPDTGLYATILVLVCLAAVKLALMPYFPGFGPDVGDYQAWASQIATFGPAHTYQQGFFLDYPPGYLYGLWVVGILAHAVGATGDFYRVVIESPAIVADFVLAFLMYALVRRTRSPLIAFIAMLMVALNPPLLYDTVVWGQSDSVMAFVTLLSIVMILGKQYEVGWALAAIAVLVKPQGLMLLPVLGVWTMFETPFRTWISSGVALIAAAIIGIAPFQISQDWNWIFKLYGSTAAYYHETSVNAFNLMALIGGLRQADSGTIAGVSYFALGMSLLVPLYLFVTWILWRGRTPTRLIFASFIAIFGFFMVAPRMHERYLYPAIALAVPLALEAPEMLVVFVIITATCLVNLIDILHTLNTVVFLDARDRLAMWTSAFNVVALALAVYYGALRMREGSQLGMNFGALVERFTIPKPAEERVDQPAVEPLPWMTTDTIIVSALLIIAAITRYWHLSHPGEIVFDEVHFVAQGRHYLHRESFLDPHPPLAKLVIAMGILLFGDNPFGWRVGNATIGTALVGITYLLGRRMSGSRLVGALAGAIILCDGMYVVDSHYAVIDIVYLTCAAVSYWLFFKFAQAADRRQRRQLLAWIGLALGLCLASKLYIPAITFLMVMGFIVYVLAKKQPDTVRDPVPDQLLKPVPNPAPNPAPAEAKPGLPGKSKKAKSPVLAPVPIPAAPFDWNSIIFISLTCLVIGLLLLLSGIQVTYGILIIVAVIALRGAEILWRPNSSSMPASSVGSIRLPSMAKLLEPMTVGAIVLVGSIASITYLAVFVPHYYLVWRGGGIWDLFKYYSDVVWYEKSVASATHPYSSPWYSWPLMLRPIAYWQNFPKTGDVQTVWGGGNPVLWWGALTAITITGVQAIERPSLTRAFLVVGYLSYLLIWAWIGRTLFLYHYMASVYFGYLALAILLADCFKERAEPWEHIALLLTMTPVFFLGLPAAWAWIAFFAIMAGYVAVLLRTRYPGRYVGGVFATVALILFVYYFPVWVGMPISREGYYARMWLSAGGLFNWI